MTLRRCTMGQSGGNEGGKSSSMPWSRNTTWNENWSIQHPCSNEPCAHLYGPSTVFKQQVLLLSQTFALARYVNLRGYGWEYGVGKWKLKTRTYTETYESDLEHKIYWEKRPQGNPYRLMNFLESLSGNTVDLCKLQQLKSLWFKRFYRGYPA